MSKTDNAQSGDSSVVERQTHNQKITGSSPSRRIFFSESTFCADCYFIIHSTPMLLQEAHKRSWSLCQKCRWEVTVKHTCTRRMWLCMRWCDMVHGCVVYTERTQTAAISCDTSRVTTKQCCKRNILVKIQNMKRKASHSFRSTCDEHSESAEEQRIVLYKCDQPTTRGMKFYRLIFHMEKYIECHSFHHLFASSVCSLPEKWVYPEHLYLLYCPIQISSLFNSTVLCALISKEKCIS